MRNNGTTLLARNFADFDLTPKFEKTKFIWLQVRISKLFCSENSSTQKKIILNLHILVEFPLIRCLTK